MAGRLYESRGLGGPLDGIKIGSGLGWDGRVPMRKTPVMVYYHAGRYKWNPVHEVWEWKPEPIPPESIKKATQVGRPCLDRITKTT